MQVNLPNQEELQVNIYCNPHAFGEATNIF